MINSNICIPTIDVIVISASRVTITCKYFSILFMSLMFLQWLETYSQTESEVLRTRCRAPVLNDAGKAVGRYLGVNAGVLGPGVKVIESQV